MRVGMEQSQETDLSVKLTQEELTTNQKPLETSPELGDALQRAVSPEAIKFDQRKFARASARSVAVSRPDICARIARIASRKNSRQGSEVYRINDPVETAQLWQHATTLKYASSSHTGTPARGDVDGRMHRRGLAGCTPG